MATIEELEQQINVERKKIDDTVKKKELTRELNILRSPAKRNIREGLQRTGRGLKVIGRGLGKASAKLAEAAIRAEKQQVTATRTQVKKGVKARKKARRKSKANRKKAIKRVTARTNDNDGFGLGGFGILDF